MSAWGEQNKADGKIRMLADTTGSFTKVSLLKVKFHSKHILCCSCLFLKKSCAGKMVVLI